MFVFISSDQSLNRQILFLFPDLRALLQQTCYFVCLAAAGARKNQIQRRLVLLIHHVEEFLLTACVLGFLLVMLEDGAHAFQIVVLARYVQHRVPLVLCFLLENGGAML